MSIWTSPEFYTSPIKLPELWDNSVGRSSLVMYQWICNHVDGDVELLVYSFGHVDWRSYQHLVMQQRQEFLQPLVEFVTTAFEPSKKSRTRWEALHVLARVTGTN